MIEILSSLRARPQFQMQALYAIEFGVLCGLLVLLFVRWRRLLFPASLRLGGGERIPRHFEDYLARSIRRLAALFMVVYGCWTLFYATRLFQYSNNGFDNPQVRCLANLLNNFATYFLFQFYLELSAFKRPAVSSKEYSRILLHGWFFIISAVTVFEFLSNRGATESASFMVVYGLGQSVALFLIVGRLESAFVGDHIRANKRTPSLLRFQIGVFLGYLYAAIQPLYPLFMGTELLGLFVVVVAALVLKVCLVGWMDMLFQPRSRDGSISCMQSLVYETERFSTEELSSFERSFLRTHLGSLFRKRFKEREIGYLGIEYAYLNKYKRNRLFLTESIGGLLVQEIYPGTTAMEQGIKCWDYITHIGGIPLGENNHLSDCLTGVALDGHVEVRLLRKRKPHEEIQSSAGYEEINLEIQLQPYDKLIKAKVPPGASARIGCLYLHNSLEHGVVCRWPEDSTRFRITGIRSFLSDRHYETPDVRMLRLVLGQLIPGEQIELVGENLYERGRDGSAGATRMRQAVAMRAGPPELLDSSRYETTAGRWTPIGEETATAPETRAQLSRLYRDRVKDATLSSRKDSPEWLVERKAVSMEKGCTVHVFDERKSRLFEYHCRGIDVVRVTRQLRVWREVESGLIHMYIKSPGKASLAPWRGNSFVTFMHDRGQYAPKLDSW